MENSGSLGENVLLGKNIKTALFLFLICFISWPSATNGFSLFAESINDTLTVITYNIHHGRGIDGNIDLNRIANVINQSKADIAALQEVDIKTERSGNIDILQILSEKTGLEHTAFGLNLEFDGGMYGNAILSKYPIETYQNHHYKNISDEQRGVLTAVIRVKEFPILFLNTHLDHTADDDSERVLYAEMIRDEIIPLFKDQSIILAGDLNDIPGSTTYQIINNQLHDSWILGKYEDGFTIPVKNPEKRIDYIFYSGNLKPIDAEVIRSKASDHLPVVVKFMYSND